MHWTSSFYNILQMLNQFCWRNFSHRAWDWMKKKMIEKAKWKTWMKILCHDVTGARLNSARVVFTLKTDETQWKLTFTACVFPIFYSVYHTHTHRQRDTHTHTDRETHSVFLLIIPFGIVKRNQFVLYNPDSYANTFNYTQNSISLYVVYCFAIANNESEKKRNKNRREEWAWCKYTKWSLNSCLRTYSIVYFAIHRCWENIQEAYFLRYF